MSHEAKEVIPYIAVISLCVMALLIFYPRATTRQHHEFLRTSGAIHSYCVDGGKSISVDLRGRVTGEFDDPAC
jgi:hypothetical protein